MAKYTITVELSVEDKACVTAVLRAHMKTNAYSEGLADDADALSQVADALTLAEPMTKYDLELEAEANAHEEVR